MKRSTIDVFQIHSPQLSTLQNSDWADGLDRLRRDGKVRFTAVAIRGSEDGCWLIREGLVDVLQVTYNIRERSVEQELLSLAGERRVGLLARLPLCRGVLIGKFRLGQLVDDGLKANMLGKLLAERIERAETLRELASAYPGGMTRLAHHFSLSHPAVSCIIPGARNIEQLKETVAASTEEGLPADVREELERRAL